MINTRIGISLMGIAVALAMAGGAALAFFTDSETSTNNTISTGTLSIVLDDTDLPFQDSLPITNLVPNEERLVRFDVLNSGTVPVFLRAFAIGSWLSPTPTLDDTKVKVTKAEYWDGAAWTTITSNPAGLTGLVYYSPNGLDASLFEVAVAENVEFRLTVVLDSTADNTYQNQTYNTSLTVHARQTTSGATWPL